MKQKKVFLFLILLFFIGLASGSIFAADIVGTVTDTDTGLPIPNVVIKIIETGDSTMTDVSGNYFIPNVVNGSYTLLAGSVNYTPLIFTKTIGSCCIMRGDVNGSGSINVSDLVYLVAYSFQSGPAPTCEEHGDVNGSGSINVSDLVYLVAYSFQDGTQPVPCL